MTTEYSGLFNTENGPRAKILSALGGVSERRSVRGAALLALGDHVGPKWNEQKNRLDSVSFGWEHDETLAMLKGWAILPRIQAACLAGVTSRAWMLRPVSATERPSRQRPAHL